MPILGVIILGSCETLELRYAYNAPLHSSQAIHQLHEMFHLVQLKNIHSKDPLLDRVQSERDADQAAVTAFQNGCNGSPVHAARYIMARTMDTVWRSTEEYYFWPGLGANDLLCGPLVANSLFLLGLYEQSGQTRPTPALMEQWSLRAFMPRDMYEQHRIELDRVNAFVAETVRQQPQGPAAGLKCSCGMVFFRMSNFNSPYPKTLRAEAVRLVKEGISRKEVSARLGIPLSTLKSWFPKLQRQMTELHERIAMLEEQNLELRFQLKLVSSRRRGLS